MGAHPIDQGARHGTLRRRAAMLRQRAYARRPGPTTPGYPPHPDGAYSGERMFGLPPIGFRDVNGPYPSADELAAFRAELCGCPGWNGESHAEACPLRDDRCPCGWWYRGDRQDDAHDLHCCPVCYRDVVECGGHSTMARPLTDPERAALARTGPVAQPCEACGAPAPHLCDCTP